MRKILSLFALLLLCIGGAWAQPDVSGKTFTLNCARGYVYWTSSGFAGTNVASQATKFAFVEYESETYLYDTTNKAFVCHTTDAKAGTSGNRALESSSDLSKIAKGFKFGTTNIEAYPYYLEDSWGNWLNMDGSPIVYLNTWKNFEGGNGGNTYNVTIVDTDFNSTEAVAILDAYFHPSATVKYVIRDANGVVYTSEAAPATIGETITTLPTSYQRAFCSYEVTPVTTTNGENTVDVNVTYSLPFEVGTDKLYLAKLRGHYVYYDATNNDVRTNQSSKEFTYAYMWSFYGNPYSGIKVKNASTNTYLDNTTNNVQLSEGGYGWTISRLNDTTFGLNNGSDYINEQNHTNHNLIYWWAFSTDQGSQWTVEEVPDLSEVTYVVKDTDGERILSEKTELVPAGEVITSIPSELREDFALYSYEPTSLTTEANTNHTFTATKTGEYNYPFRLSAEGNEYWYYVKTPSHYLRGNTCTSTTKNETDVTYRYAFIGENYADGFTIKNGDGQYLDAYINEGNGYSMAVRKGTEGSVFKIHDSFSDNGTFRLSHASEMVEGRDVYLGRLYNGDFLDGLVVWTDLSRLDDGILSVEEAQLIDFEASDPTSITDGWYQIQWTDNASDNATGVVANPGGYYVTNHAQDVSYGDTNYPLYLNTDFVPMSLNEHATTFVYVSGTQANGAYGKVGSLRSANGHFVNITGSASATATGNLYFNYFSASSYPKETIVTSANSGNRNSWIPYENDGVQYIGQSSQNKFPKMKFSAVDLSTIGLEAWTVIVEGFEEEIAASNIQLTYTGSNSYGLKQVYKGGTIFFAKDFTPSATDFTAPAQTGLEKSIRVDGATHTVTLLYIDKETLRQAVETLETKLTPYQDLLGNNLGEYVVENVEEMKDAISSAKTVLNNTEATAAEVISATESISAYNTAFSASLNMPKFGTFLRIKNPDGRYLTNERNSANNSGAAAFVEDGTDNNTIFFYAEGSEYNGNLGGSLLNYKTATYLGANGYGNRPNGIGAAVVDNYFFQESSVAAKQGKYGIRFYPGSDTTYRWLYAWPASTTGTGNKANTADQNSTDHANCVFTLEAVTELPIALANCKEYLNASEDVFYTTLFMPVKVKVTGAEVYKVVEGAEANTLDMELIADGVVPANTGVILKNDTGAATATICTDESDATSVLTGTVPAINAVSDCYVLSVANEKLGFYKFAGEALKGFRAYYVEESADPTRGFVLNMGGTQTGIGSSLVTGNSSQVYDLQGRRVNAPAKGLYIINGKKVVK